MREVRHRTVAPKLYFYPFSNRAAQREADRLEIQQLQVQHGLMNAALTDVIALC